MPNTSNNKKNNKLIHVFNGDLYFNVLPILEVMLRHSRMANHFVVLVADPNNKLKYQELFNTWRCTEFTILSKKLGCNRFGDALNKILSLMRYSGHVVVFHGNFSLSHVFVWLPVFKKVVWVCWCFQFKKQQSLFRQVVAAVQVASYRRYAKILCTLRGDADEFEQVCGCKNCQVLPYPCDFERLCRTGVSRREKSLGVRVLLGNNAHMISNYLELLPELAHFERIERLTCMVAHGAIDRQKKAELDSLGLNLFGSRYHAWETVLPIEEFNKSLMEYDIYISSGLLQGGLGTIYTMIFYGKKLYIAGRNLDWIRSHGIVVNDADSILKESVDGFCKPVSQAESANNIRQLAESFGVPSQSLRWDRFFANLLK